MGLSDYVLEGVLKHDSDVFSEKITSIPLKDQLDVERLCGIVGIGSHKAVKQKIQTYYANNDTFIDKYPETFIGSIESQIVAWADKIAYLGHDWEEFLDNKLLEKLMSRINDMIHKMFEITGKITDKREKYYLDTICFRLKEIEKIYAKLDETEKTYKTFAWEKVYKELLLIIEIIDKIVCEAKFDHFSSKEYMALKDYFIMVISWSKLLDKYPSPQALKYDPIYIFYLYLSEVRTTIITKSVTKKIIIGSNSILSSLNLNTREEYLLYCNKRWVDIFNEIRSNPKIDDKSKKKQLKDSVRTCYLVQFGTEQIVNNTSVIEYAPHVIRKSDSGYYYFGDTYGCLLNIISCIFSQYITSTRVSFMTQQAKKIVTGLMDYYINHPEMLPYSQRRRYTKNLNECTEELIYFIADYVGGMTDRMAKKKYDEITSSDTKWSNEYSSGLN